MTTAKPKLCRDCNAPLPREKQRCRFCDDCAANRHKHDRFHHWLALQIGGRGRRDGLLTENDVIQFAIKADPDIDTGKVDLLKLNAALRPAVPGVTVLCPQLYIAWRKKNGGKGGNLLPQDAASFCVGIGRPAKGIVFDEPVLADAYGAKKMRAVGPVVEHIVTDRIKLAAEGESVAAIDEALGGVRSQLEEATIKSMLAEQKKMLRFRAA